MQLRLWTIWTIFVMLVSKSTIELCPTLYVSSLHLYYAPISLQHFHHDLCDLFTQARFKMTFWVPSSLGTSSIIQRPILIMFVSRQVNMQQTTSPTIHQSYSSPAPVNDSDGFYTLLPLMPQNRYSTSMHSLLRRISNVEHQRKFTFMIRLNQVHTMKKPHSFS